MSKGLENLQEGFYSLYFVHNSLKCDIIVKLVRRLDKAIFVLKLNNF